MKSIRKHLEWFVFLSGLVLLGLMDPASQASSFCLFDFMGINFCPGDGLGHSIAHTFRGNFESAFAANLMGPFAVVILSFRIMYIWKNLYTQKQNREEDITHG